jgi:hypothetical protein
MLCRLEKLKKYVDQYTALHAVHLQINEEEWGQISYLISILRPFAIYTQLIGASRNPTIHSVYDIYNLLINHIEEIETKMEKKRAPWKVEIYQALGSAKDKLIEYYSRTVDSPHGTLYGIAILLDPRKKYTTWQQPEWSFEACGRDWQEEYWVVFEEIYARDYSTIIPRQRRRMVPTALRQKSSVNLDTVIDGLNTSNSIPRERRLPDETGMTDAEREFQDYRQWSKFSGSFSGSSDR